MIVAVSPSSKEKADCANADPEIRKRINKNRSCFMIADILLMDGNEGSVKKLFL